MPLTPHAARTKPAVLYILVAALALAAAASPLLEPAHAAGTESVQVFAGDCATPQTIFNLGDTVCVRAADFPLPPAAAEYYRRVNLSAPGLGVVDTLPVFADPDYYRFWIPSTGTFALPGKWRVQTVDIETNTRADASFTVRNPRLYLADLHIWKQGPDFVLPGDRVRYLLTVKNLGPDFAEGVQFVEEVPSNATFYALKADTALPFECQTPLQGGTGRIVCTVKGLRPDESALFYAYYVVDERAKAGDSCEGLAQVSSYTSELNKRDNTTSYKSLITSPLLQEPPPYEEVDNPRGYEGEKTEYPAPEPVNSPTYEGEKVRLPAPEPVNPPDYKGEEVIWPDPEKENP